MLFNTLGFSVLRLRRDMTKLLTFAKLYGMLNLKRLEKLKEDTYILTPQVSVEALEIALFPLLTMLSRVDERTVAIFKVF